MEETSSSSSSSNKSKILIIGGSGYVGRWVVEASCKEGHPTFVLVRELAPSDPSKASLLLSFQAKGITLLQGDINDHESLVKALRLVDVVISTVGFAQLTEQVKIISAIKDAPNIKRFLPSEFGNDVDRSHVVPPVKFTFDKKVIVRRSIEKEGIPYTYVCSNFFMGYFLSNIVQLGDLSTTSKKVIILGEGKFKGIFVHEQDIGTYTIRAIDDPRTLNKILYINPPANTLSMDELVACWEKKTGKPLRRDYVPDEEVIERIQGSSFPVNAVLAIQHSVFVKGDQTNFAIEPSLGVEASTLYPDVKYTTVEEYLDRLV